MIVMLDKVTDECWYRLAALSQGRDKDRRRVHTVVEIVAELARLYHRAQIAIGRRDQPDIHFVAMRRAYGLDFVGLDRAQQLGLKLERQFRDLVEKQRATIGGAEVALRFLARVGECAAEMTEQLRLSERLDQVG